MADLLYLPIEQNFETTFAQKLTADASDLTVYLNAVPSATIPSGLKFIGTANPKTAQEENMIIESIDTAAKTLTVASSGRAQALGNAKSGSLQEHSIGDKFIISDAYVYWSDIKDAVASKLDESGGTMTGALLFSGTDHAGLRLITLTTTQRDALASPTDGDIIYNTTAGEVQAYIAGSWDTLDVGTPTANATDTVAGKVEISTDAESVAGTTLGGSGASLSSTPDQIAERIQNQEHTYVQSTGAANVQSITLVPAVTSLTTGLEVCYKANNANTGAVTLNVNGLGAVALTDNNANALVGGEITSQCFVRAKYDGTRFRIISVTDNLMRFDSTSTDDDIMVADSGTTYGYTFKTPNVVWAGSGASGTISATGNTDVTITPGFQAGVIELHVGAVVLPGTSPWNFQGVFVFDGTTFKFRRVAHEANSSGTSDNGVAILDTITTTTNSALTSTSTDMWSLIISITNVTATSFDVRFAATKTGLPSDISSIVFGVVVHPAALTS